MDLKRINYLYHKLPYKILGMLHKKNVSKKKETADWTMMGLCEISEEYSGNYFTVRERPKKTDEISVTLNNNKYALSAIVLQGPIMSEDDFTAETVKLYKRLYPSDLVIVSTWCDEKPESIISVQNAGAIVVQSEKPSFGGHGNINFQLVNTKAGVVKARELGAQYICKTRTDQRIYHANVIEYMVNLLQIFPSNNTDSLQKQNKRIVCCGMEYGNLFYPFFMSDFFYFGTADEMCNLFDIELDMRKSVESPKGNTRRECASKDLVTEIQILRNYVRKLGCNDECTVENYWKFIKYHLICVNKDSIGLFWPKYNSRYFEHVRNGYYYNSEPLNNFKCYNWDFIQWLNLYNGTIQYEKEYERYADFVVN